VEATGYAGSLAVRRILFFDETPFWGAGHSRISPMESAAIASTDQFRHRDFRRSRRPPAHLRRSFVGFFGSLEEVNAQLRVQSKTPRKWIRRPTPAHLL